MHGDGSHLNDFFNYMKCSGDNNKQVNTKDCDTINQEKFVQCAGHKGNFFAASSGTLWKHLSPDEPSEGLIYASLARYGISDLAPQMHREIKYNGEVYLEMENLLSSFQCPNIMDIKLGVRTFTEKEAECPSLRTDMYERLMAIKADEPTKEEHAAQAITKYRYLMFRSLASTTAELGFRISAFKNFNEMESNRIDLKRLNRRTEVIGALSRYLKNSVSKARKMLDRLVELRERLETSGFLCHHEMIGTSLLFLYDDISDAANIWLIDFAKVIFWKDVELSHRASWSPGNHEEGFLTGLDNLIKIFRELVTAH